MLASYIGREKVNELIDNVAGMRVTFANYPTNAYFIQTLRREVNNLIKEHVGRKKDDK